MNYCQWISEPAADGRFKLTCSVCGNERYWIRPTCVRACRPGQSVTAAGALPQSQPGEDAAAALPSRADAVQLRLQMICGACEHYDTANGYCRWADGGDAPGRDVWEAWLCCGDCPQDHWLTDPAESSEQLACD
jgi:hypothetical protein